MRRNIEITARTNQFCFPFRFPLSAFWLLRAGCFLFSVFCFLQAGAASVPKQKSLDEWRALSAPDAVPPRVFVKRDTVHFYFQAETNFVEFSARWTRLRVPTASYRVSSALLHWEARLPALPKLKPGCTEA